MPDPVTHKGRALVGPVVNINGTSRADLVRGFSNAHMALLRACKAIAEAAPHPRDFQTCVDPQDAYRAARDQHADRMTTLHEITSEYADMSHMLINANMGEMQRKVTTKAGK